MRASSNGCPKTWAVKIFSQVHKWKIANESMWIVSIIYRNCWCLGETSLHRKRSKEILFSSIWPKRQQLLVWLKYLKISESELSAEQRSSEINSQKLNSKAKSKNKKLDRESGPKVSLCPGVSFKLQWQWTWYWWNTGKRQVWFV